MSRSQLLNVANRAGVRPDVIAFAQYFARKDKKNCIYATDFSGNGKLYLEEEDPDEGKRLLQILTDGVMACGDKRLRIPMPQGGFVATGYIGGIDPSNDGSAAVISDTDGQALFWFPEEEYGPKEEVIAELIKAVNSAGKRKPHIIDWASLQGNIDEPKNESTSDLKSIPAGSSDSANTKKASPTTK